MGNINNVYTRVHTYIYMYTYTYIQMYTYTHYTHTRTHAHRLKSIGVVNDKESSPHFSAALRFNEEEDTRPS